MKTLADAERRSEINLYLNGNEIGINNEGYLLNSDDCSPELAAVTAHKENIELTNERLEIVHFVRKYFEERECIPELRTRLKELRENTAKKQPRDDTFINCSFTATISRPARSPACASR